ncbi:dynamin domain containing protein [Acanthamoeba castellanii str. Neff]|uniref:Dynamin domain containing protein n=1 Tax=Acanthamoeba castellanii (strain ATCC 30010 / Neff) TaxID=1257118 RepID=L8GJ37_ACACF|nr:dynamin domain containing protein [Acanthamoeba castellanii str. Neff]ELR12768.1 dynamin domain containing protein [Acanthamoeba castellanii str. Neff]
MAQGRRDDFSADAVYIFTRSQRRLARGGFSTPALPSAPNKLVRRRQATATEVSLQKGEGKEGLRRVLNADQAALLQQEICLLEDVLAFLQKIGADQEDVELLKQTREQLEELFLLVVVGEFNAGKSAFLNAMLGKKYLKEGVIPTTSKITSIRHGETASSVLPTEEPDREVIYLPVDWLKDLNLVDTPGTNAILKYHQQITEHFVPRSDMVLFVTSSDRALSESEHQFLNRIRQWKKKVLVVLQKVDLLEDEAQLEELRSFVAKGMSQLLGIQPKIFPVSARLALKAKQLMAKENASAEVREKAEAAALWEKSRWAELETYILKSLDAGERSKLKLKNPLGIAHNLLNKYKDVTESRLQVLAKDITSIEHIEEQLEEYRKEMKRDYEFQQNRIDNVLLELANRGDAFFDEHLSLSNIFALARSEKLRGEFERTVVAETAIQIERSVSDLIDWTVDKNSKQWRRVVDYALERAAHHAQSEGLIGKVESEFDYNRAKLLDTMGAGVRNVVASYDKTEEARQLANEVQTAIYSTAAIEVTALGVGSLVVASLLDFTVKRIFNEKIAGLRVNMRGVMHAHFDRELADNIRKIQGSVSPYTLYVKTEKEKLTKTKTRIEDTMKRVSNSIHSIDLAFQGESAEAPEEDLQ